MSQQNNKMAPTMGTNSARENHKKHRRKVLIWMCLSMAVIASVLFVVASIPIMSSDSPNFGQAFKTQELANLENVSLNLCCALIVAFISITVYKNLYYEEDRDQEIYQQAFDANTKCQETWYQGLQKSEMGIKPSHLMRVIENSNSDIVNTYLNGDIISELGNSYKKAFTRGHQVRIALLHPLSDMVPARIEDLAHTGHIKIISHIEANLGLLAQWRREWMAANNQKTPRLEVYLYDRLPMAAVRGDGTILVGFFLRDTLSSNGPQCLYETGSPAGLKFENHMDSYFQGSKTRKIDLDDLENEMKMLPV
jgi:hypothetical protein